MLPMACHRCDISWKGVVLIDRNDAEIGLANSLHASAQYGEYNEKLDLIKFLLLLADWLIRLCLPNNPSSLVTTFRNPQEIGGTCFKAGTNIVSLFEILINGSSPNLKQHNKVNPALMHKITPFNSTVLYYIY